MEPRTFDINQAIFKEDPKIFTIQSYKLKVQGIYSFDVKILRGILSLKMRKMRKHKEKT